MMLTQVPAHYVFPFIVWVQRGFIHPILLISPPWKHVTQPPNTDRSKSLWVKGDVLANNTNWYTWSVCCPETTPRRAHAEALLGTTVLNVGGTVEFENSFTECDSFFLNSTPTREWFIFPKFSSNKMHYSWGPGGGETIFGRWHSVSKGDLSLSHVLR